MMNKKGFTLVELLGTIIILALVMSIAGFSITTILNSSKAENYQLLVRRIDAGAELYYQECKYDDKSAIKKYCEVDNNNGKKGYKITIGNLVTYGYMTANGKMSDSVNTTNVNNPKVFRPDDTDKYIDDCLIKVYFDPNTKKTVVEALSNDTGCPTNKEYKGDFSK